MNTEDFMKTVKTVEEYLPKNQDFSRYYRVEMFKNSRGSFTVIKINTITDSISDFQEFADKNSAVAFAIENGAQLKDLA